MSSCCRRCAFREDLRLHQRRRELDEVESARIESGQNRGHVVHDKSAQTPATIHRYIDRGRSSHPGAVRS